MSQEQDEKAVWALTSAIRDEYGSRLCVWIDAGTVRACAINVPPHKCRCKALAEVTLETLRNLGWRGPE